MVFGEDLVDDGMCDAKNRNGLGISVGISDDISIGITFGVLRLYTLVQLGVGLLGMLLAPTLPGAVLSISAIHNTKKATSLIPLM